MVAEAFERVCEPEGEQRWRRRRRARGADEVCNKGWQSHVPWFSFRSIGEVPFLDRCSLLEASSSLVLFKLAAGVVFVVG